VRVEVTNGMALGAIGKVKAAWGRDWQQGEALWVIGFDGLIRQRVIRESYLRVLP
jgi:hypothetical protein